MPPALKLKIQEQAKQVVALRKSFVRIRESQGAGCPVISLLRAVSRR
jgi:hypothetical protein